LPFRYCLFREKIANLKSSLKSTEPDEGGRTLALHPSRQKGRPLSVSTTMKHLISVVALALFFSCAASAQSGQPRGRCVGLKRRAEALAREYRELRDRRRRSSRENFDRELDASGGKLHEVLASLGVELGHRPYTKRIITGCLGGPDAIKRGNQMESFLGVYNRERGLARRKIGVKRREYLIYFWRGWHDFLFFISEGGSIVDHGWWFAYE
jgi:hypothetical protein